MNVNRVIERISAKEKRRIKQSEIAKIVGFSREYLSKMVKTNKNFSEDKIEILEKHFNIDLSQQEEASPERPDWLKDLTGKEELFLQELIEKDKELLSLFYGACSGDQKKIKLFCQYLASRYGVDVDL